MIRIRKVNYTQLINITNFKQSTKLFSNCLTRLIFFSILKMQALITPSYGNDLVILFVQDKQKDNSFLSRVNQILLLVVVWKRLLALPSFGNVTILLGLPSDLAKPIGGSDGKVSARSAGDPGSIPGLGRSPGKGNGNPLQYSCLENSMD